LKETKAEETETVDVRPERGSMFTDYVSKQLSVLHSIDPFMVGIVSKLQVLPQVKRTWFSCAGVGPHTKADPWAERKKAGTNHKRRRLGPGSPLLYRGYLVLEYAKGTKWETIHETLAISGCRSQQWKMGEMSYLYEFQHPDAEMMIYTIERIEDGLNLYTYASLWDGK
jgi:hypothetical protein